MITCSESVGFERDVLVFRNERGVRLEVPAEYACHEFQVVEHHGDIFALPPKTAPLLAPVIAVKTRVVYPRGGAIARTKG